MTRPLNVIAAEILTAYRDNPNYASRKPAFMTYSEPYVRAMLELKDAKGFYGVDRADDVVLRFLVNASRWRHPRTAAIRAELRQHIYNAKETHENHQS